MGMSGQLEFTVDIVEKDVHIAVMLKFYRGLMIF